MSNWHELKKKTFRKMCEGESGKKNEQPLKFNCSKRKMVKVKKAM